MESLEVLSVGKVILAVVSPVSESMLACSEALMNKYRTPRSLIEECCRGSRYPIYLHTKRSKAKISSPLSIALPCSSHRFLSHGVGAMRIHMHLVVAEFIPHASKQYLCLGFCPPTHSCEECKGVTVDGTCDKLMLEILPDFLQFPVPWPTSDRTRDLYCADVLEAALAYGVWYLWEWVEF